MTRWPWIQSHWREVALFALGAIGFLHEVFWQMGERPFLIAATCSLMGMPLLMSGEKAIHRGKGDGGPADPKEPGA